MPDPDEIASALSSMREPVEVCFFGGSFGSLPRDAMASLLAAASCAPDGSRLTFSTYPSDLDGARGTSLLEAVSCLDIGTIELGVPSLDPDVLRACRRHDDPDAILRAIARVRDAGLHVGVQTMIGLPSQSEASARDDHARIAALMPDGAAWHLRIYPCLVLKGTELEAMYARGEYSPLSLDDAVSTAASLLSSARSLGFVPIRVGLHDSPSLRGSVVAGPYHPAFGELAKAEAAVREMLTASARGPWRMRRADISLLTGHGARGLRRLAAAAGTTPKDALASISFT